MWFWNSWNYLWVRFEALKQFHLISFFFWQEGREKEARREPEEEVSFHPPSTSPHLVLCLGHGRHNCKFFSLLEGPDLAEMSRVVAIKYSRGPSALCMEAPMAEASERCVTRGMVVPPHPGSAITLCPLGHFLEPPGTLWCSWAYF